LPPLDRVEQVGDRPGREALAALLRDVAAGWFPPPDGGVTILPQPGARDAGVIGFTAHAVVFIDADPAWVTAQLPAGDLAGPLSPAFLQALCVILRIVAAVTGRRPRERRVDTLRPGRAGRWWR
jgi:hypothetical protein